MAKYKQCAAADWNLTLIPYKNNQISKYKSATAICFLKFIANDYFRKISSA